MGFQPCGANRADSIARWKTSSGAGSGRYSRQLNVVRITSVSSIARRYILLISGMCADSLTAPKVCRGRFFEDFAAGDVFRSRFGRR